MANIYVGGATANDSNSGASWALAKATITGAMAIATTADTVVIDQDYAQNAAATVSIAGPATTNGEAVRIETGVITGSNPPVQDFYGASIATTGASSSISLTGNLWVAGGIGFTLSTSGGTANIGIGNAAGNDITAESIYTTMTGAGTGQRVSIGMIGTGTPGSITIDSLTSIFGHTSQMFAMGQSKVRINKLTMVLGARINNLMSTVSQRGVDVVIMGGDISRLAVAGNIAVMGSGTGKIVLARMKMPQGWTGGAFSATPTVRTPRIELHDCFDDLGNLYDIEEDSFGKGMLSAVHARAGGRTRAALLTGRTGMTTYPACPFVYELEPIWNEVVGSEITISVPVLADGAEPTDAEIALRVTHDGTTVVTVPGADGMRSTLFAAQQLNTKYGTSAGWTTTFASPKPRKIDVPVTAGAAGFMKVEVLVFAPREFAVDVPVVL